MMISKILIGVDDSKYAENAAAYGFDIARKFNAAVGLVNIIEPVIIPQMTQGADSLVGSSLTDPGAEEMEIMYIQKGHADDIVNNTIKKFAQELQVTHFAGYGSTAEGIINCAKEYGADLIVIGTHNRSGLDRLLMGSVAEHVIRHATVPVLVVPLGS